MVFLESPLLIQHYVGNLEQVVAMQRKQGSWHGSQLLVGTEITPPRECKLGMIMLLNHINTWESVLISSVPMFTTDSFSPLTSFNAPNCRNLRIRKVNPAALHCTHLLVLGNRTLNGQLNAWTQTVPETCIHTSRSEKVLTCTVFRF